MQTKVTTLRQLGRGLEAQVVLGDDNVPGAHVKLTVTLNNIDPEWVELRDKVHDLICQRATETLTKVAKAKPRKAARR